MLYSFKKPSGWLLLLCLFALGLLTSPLSASADINNTRADAWGTLELSGSNWLGGQGVGVYSNGSTTDFRDCSGNIVSSYSAACKGSVNGVTTGAEYQCVELVNRLYLTRGWISSTWTGNGDQMYTNAPSGLLKQANGSITYLGPGDVVSLGDSTTGTSYDDGGHVAVVNSVSGSTAQIVNQNTTAVYSSATFSSGSLSMVGWSGYYVIGVIHAPASSTSIKIAYVDTSGNAWIKDGTINTTYTKIWDHSLSTAAADIQLSPNRIAIRDVNGNLYVSQYPSISWVLEYTSVSSAAKYRIADGNIAVLDTGTLFIKQGTGSSGLSATWHSDATNVSNFQMSQNGNVAATFTDGTVWDQWGGYGNSWVELTGGWIPYSIANNATGIVNGGELYVMNGAPGNNSWNPAMSNAAGVQLAAGGNLAGVDTSGYLNVAWGGYGSTWTSQVANNYTSYQLTDTQLGVLYGNSLDVKEGTASGGWTLVADNAVSFALS